MCKKWKHPVTNLEINEEFSQKNSGLKKSDLFITHENNNNISFTIKNR